MNKTQCAIAQKAAAEGGGEEEKIKYGREKSTRIVTKCPEYRHLIGKGLITSNYQVQTAELEVKTWKQAQELEY